MNSKNIFLVAIVLLISILHSCYVIQTAGNPDPDSDVVPAEKERINDINYLADEIDRTKDETKCAYAINDNPDGLLITEVTRDWIEIFNNNSKGSDPICLGEYKLRASTLDHYDIIRNYSLLNYPIEPQSYVVIRFNGNSKNISSDLMIVNGPGLEWAGSQYVGTFELVRSNTSIDFVSFCLGTPGNRTTGPSSGGSFSGCVDYRSADYLSFSRINLVDTDASSDWRFTTIPTFGGPNDVIDDTDSDQDGIPDANEREGTTFAGMPLYEWGARENQRDIFIHINYMDGREKKLGLTPWKESLDLISKTFAKSGFKIHLDVGRLHSSRIDPGGYNLSGVDHEVLYSTYVTIDENAYVGKQIPEGELFSLIYYKNRYMPINRFGVFHYVLFANIYADLGNVDEDILGIAELPGNDFLLFLGGDDGYNSLTSRIYQYNFTASVFFHELGHNLNLRHGGLDDENYKPNHFSIMNYGYTFRGVPVVDDPDDDNFFYRYLIGFQNLDIKRQLKYDVFLPDFKLDYSHGVLPVLNENQLSEINPLGQGLGNIDWNNDGVIQTNPYSYDVNPVNTKGNSIRLLKDYDEWENLAIPFVHGSVDYRSLHSRSPSVSPRFEYLRQEGTSPVVRCDFGLSHSH